MKCEQIQHYICDYLDGELPHSLQQTVDEHCTQCISCKKQIEEFRKTSLLLQLRSVPDPGDNYFENTWNVVRERMRARTVALPNIRFSAQPLSWFARFMRRPSLALATIAIIIFACITGLFWLRQARVADEEYVDNDIEYIILPKDWQPERPDFGVMPTTFQPEAEFSAYSKAAIGGIDPISKSAVIRPGEAISK